MSLSKEDLHAALQVALKAARAAGALIHECIQKRVSLNIETKSSAADMVTQYDKQCEEVVLALLTPFRKDWKIVSEETRAEEVLTDAPTWIVDPIDGTTSFVHTAYDCCVSIGLAYKKQPVLGVVFAPELNEMFTAINGEGAFLNGTKRLSVSRVTEMRRALVCLHVPYIRKPDVVESMIGIYRELLLEHHVHAIRSNGSAALDMCSVACGRLDLYFEVGICAWDVCAATVILREAGGVVYDLPWKTATNSEPLLRPIDITSRTLCAGAHDELAKVGCDLTRRYALRNFMMGGPKL